MAQLLIMIAVSTFMRPIRTVSAVMAPQALPQTNIFTSKTELNIH